MSGVKVLTHTLKKMGTGSRRHCPYFAYTFTNENYEEVLGEHVKPEDFSDQNGTLEAEGR